ncbi:MAG: SIMPL domain-containing protein [Anaerocolumna sp.]
MNENKHKMIGNIIVAVILMAGIVAASLIGVNGLVKIKSTRTSIEVTGSAKKQITSDLIVWTGYFNKQSPVLKDAYSQLEADREKVKKYLMGKGIKEDDIVFSAINTMVNYVYDINGIQTTEINNYDLSETITIRSSEIDKVTEISRSATELLNDGVQFQSYDPQYLYTKLADLKVTMLAEATKDARKRAQMIAENAGSKLGGLTEADMGVMQITPLYSNDVEDYGINDTSSMEKEITAVVHCTFEIGE